MTKNRLDELYNIIDGVLIENSLFVDNKCYELINSSDNQYTLKIKKRSNIPLTLTFSAENCTDYVMNINLIGLL